MNNPVVAINVYTVPADKKDEFMKWWYEEVKETIAGAPGFIRGRLHRSLNAGAWFNFINVVEWENALYSQEYEKSIPLMKSQLARFGGEAIPELFSIASEY